MSTTRARVDDPLTMSTTRARVDNPLTMSTTPSQCRQRAPTPVPGECPSPASDCSSERLCPPRPGGFPRKAESTTGCLGCPRARGMPYFLLQWEELNERCPLVSRDCLCPPRVRGTPARARAGRASALSRPDARGNARTRQGWPVLAGDEDAQAGERPHAPGLVPGPASPRLSATPGGTRTRTLIYRTRSAHKGAIPPLCAAPCSLIPFLVCDTEKERGQDPRGTRRTGHSCCTA